MTEMTPFEILYLLATMLAIIVSAVSLVRSRQFNARLLLLEEQSVKATNNAEQRTYRDAVRDILMRAVELEVAVMKIKSDAQNATRQCEDILARLSSSGLPGLDNTSLASLKEFCSKLRDLQQIENQYTPFFEKRRCVEEILESQNSIGRLMYEAIIDAAGSFERQEYELRNRAEHILRTWSEKYDAYSKQLGLMR